MKKKRWILFSVFLVVGFAACSSTTATMVSPFEATEMPTVTHTATVEPAIVKFIDPVLEEMVRGVMGKPEGDITVAEAEKVTRLNLSIELQQYISEQIPIKDISGLENFTNLEFLDLSFHTISDISPLRELKKLTLLSLEGNPVADITPLTGLTNLKGLSLSNCAAKDYSPLAQLVNLEYLNLDDSTITDVTPLVSLTTLQHLYLAGSPVNNGYLLANLYPNLTSKDFTIAFTLIELGFVMNDEHNAAKFTNESLEVIITHSKWGAPPMDWDPNSVRMSLPLKDGYILKSSYSPDLKAYVFGMGKDGVMLMNYVYDTTNGNITFGAGDRDSSAQAIRAAMDVLEGEDVLLAPKRIFDAAIQQTFSMDPDWLFALPFEPPTLKSLGFFPDEVNAVYLFEQREGRDVNMEVHRPEWGDKEYDVRFFTPLSDEYRIVVTYHIDERKFVVGADDNDMGGANFEFFIDTNEHIDGWCSNKEMTVEEYFINAYNDPEIEDIYLYSVEFVKQYISDTFGLTIEELYALPTGD